VDAAGGGAAVSVQVGGGGRAGGGESCDAGVCAPGDAVLIHTGWGRLWDQDGARYSGPAPGIGVGAASWLASQDVLLIGSDTTSVEVSPNPDKSLDLPVHQIALAVNGIFLLENLKLDELASKHIQEFALIVERLKIRGGTGSTVAPVAVH